MERIERRFPDGSRFIAYWRAGNYEIVWSDSWGEWPEWAAKDWVRTVPCGPDTYGDAICILQPGCSAE